MDWIESHTTIAHHPKTRKLAHSLGIGKAAAVGHLHCLWHWAAKFAQDGDLTKFDAEDIAFGAMWDWGDYDDGADVNEEVFLKALIDTGWVDEDPNGRRLHNWDTYVGTFRAGKQDASQKGAFGNHKRWHVQRRLIDPECQFCRKESGAIPPDESGESGGDSGSSHLTRPDLTEPDLTNHTISDGDVESQLLEEEMRGHFWGKHNPDDIDAAVERLTIRNRFGEHIKDPVRWLTKVLQSMAMVHSDDPGGSKRIELPDGTQMEYVNGQWVEEVNSA